ncbi:hypothetical protein R1sor_024140 [Riccia sorocarpa]|uniref:Uncharacterized protein n=1 Tax=Riccia sorocarpa TaxID=122646 RepID=A0ABD3GVM8_9MARC
MATGRRFIDGVLGGRSQIRPINVDDIGNHLWWTHFRPEEIAWLTAGVPPEILSRLVLDDFLSLQFARPNTEVVAEFIRNYSKDTHQSTVRGQQINLSLEAIRDAFHLPAGTTMCPKMKKGLHIEDWYPKEVTGLLIWYIKTKVDPDGNPEGLDLDWASIIRKNWEVELHWIQKHLRGNKKDGKLTTGLGQVEEDDEHLVPVGGGVEPPANDQPAAQDTTMEEVLPDDPSRERSAEAGQPLPSHAHAKAGPSSSYREDSGANLGSTQANRLERSKDLEPTNSGSERMRGPYIVHPIPRTIPYLLALRSVVQNCQPGKMVKCLFFSASANAKNVAQATYAMYKFDKHSWTFYIAREASRHSSTEVDITHNPDTSGSEYLIVPRRADASKHLPWAQPMEEDVRPEITALSVLLGTDRAQDRHCTPGKMVERVLFSASAKVKTVAQLVIASNV